MASGSSGSASAACPPVSCFDNATGIGRRMGDLIRYAELFERFKAHYGFEATFCNPHAGQEKGYGKRVIM